MLIKLAIHDSINGNLTAKNTFQETHCLFNGTKTGKSLVKIKFCFPRNC